MSLHVLGDQHLDHDLATIRIKNLRLRTFIGIKEEEILNRQDVVINAVIRYRADKAVAFNHIEQALNYRTITKQVIALVEENRFQLLERMTREVLDLIMSHEQVLTTQVEIDKPHALRFADSVSITLSASRAPRDQDSVS
ncbi:MULTISPECIES: dihydroneopterin triphosphate 2'-epimerase [Halomonas]|uniref:Dihydroneopterin triphosphate 2'-epimerase n=3 Tax=Halomonas TaxID=2745 RepID=A0AAU7KD88_9GAMM|nr:MULTISPECIES: dihydroneopterin triphosphate 2'-epimerase [Halomonas]MBR9771777.1 dihydroneopterin triphosphate 2'-epimerase [Gammaproteobacteria bacterium]MBR9878627.1 dihydroneopterin triphosphate 2'-epimerase [Gammaproteobacteria bacterium]MBS8267447.1 dihydroneopterin triphosphate 2'-epimerase [Halomonas litopenaei]MBY5942828.1 dihydroneopterin triphosphate 2'-epimerase [Halomonas sp. DP5N14-9]MBY6111456.1 dihydroneopterin triphosphate 2'-epimerase [Halomonas sp. DP1Y21-3]|tara:strand:+ start:1682 stop:2101 length:420 start_codon:yes stop_codon:yes gene_type:complete